MDKRGVMENTAKFDVKDIEQECLDNNISSILRALVEKGYNPIDQLTGYVLSGDPTYITNYMGARSLISGIDTYDIMSRAVEVYAKFLGVETIPPQHRVQNGISGGTESNE